MPCQILAPRRLRGGILFCWLLGLLSYQDLAVQRIAVASRRALGGAIAVRHLILHNVELRVRALAIGLPPPGLCFPEEWMEDTAEAMRHGRE